MTDLPSITVGMGASAGGIDALKTFFSGVPENPDMAFVVVTHLSPHRKSMLHDVLRRFTTLPVEAIQDGDPVRAGVVHVMPENVVLSITDGRLRLLEVDPLHRERKPIDVFFSALAADQKMRAAGIVLSGGDGDGTLGVLAIKKHGGVTFAQTEDGSGPANPEMPESAIAGGWVDFALPADQMPERLLKIQQAMDLPGSELLLENLGVSENEERRLQDEISSLLSIHTGRDFAGYKSRTFFRRVARRMLVVVTPSRQAYLERLREDPDEVMALFRDLLISVTDFFRDNSAYEALNERVMPRLLADRAADNNLRIWVPGCATGEEVYSLAILIRENMDALSHSPKVQIFATDIDEHALAIARAARYPELLLKNVSAERKVRFFRKDGASQKLAPEIREMCTFSSHSLIEDPPFSRMDLVSCRNLLIYFGLSLQQTVIPTFHYALKPGGFLFLGSSESLSQYENLFTPVLKKYRIFQSVDLGYRRPRIPMAINRRRNAEPGYEQQGLPQRVASYSLRQRAEKQVMEHHSPAHVVIRREGEIVFYSSRTRDYFDTPRGAPSRQLFETVQHQLRQDLRSALREVLETGHPAHREAVLSSDEAVQTIAMTLERLTQAGDGEALFLVVFRPVGPPRGRQSGAGPSETGQASVGADTHAIERELREVHQRLRSTIEEYETALEELETSNEELMSVNEEAQSNNEELQASKEEMHSLNEELITVNGELNDKVGELDRVNSDLRNLYEATGISSLFLDGDLVIRNFTPAAATFFNLCASDISRPLTRLASALEYPFLKQDVPQVLETGEPVERRLPPDSNHRSYLMRSTPYFDAGSITGAVITFVDITMSVNAEEQRHNLMLEAEAANKRLQESQKLEAVGRLTGGVAHDFNNLLMVILGSAESLSDELQDSRLKSMADAALKAAERGAQLVTQLLAFSRQQPHTPQAVDVNTSISSVKELVRRTITSEIDVVLSLDPDLWMAETDPSQLEVALLNLVINSRDAMPDGGRLTIATANLSLEEPQVDSQNEIEAGDYVTLTVSDTGVGMSEQLRQRVFEPFFTTKDKDKGSGLGLPSVYGFMKQSHGHISIDSEVGEWTSVRLFLPRAAGVEPDTAEAESDETPSGHGEHILVVEDDSLVRTLATALVRSLGYQVSEAESGPEAMKILRSQQPVDLLFTDVEMSGGMNGRQLAESARQLRPDLKVLYTSGYSDKLARDDDIALLQKPYVRKTLARQIRSALLTSR